MKQCTSRYSICSVGTSRRQSRALFLGCSACTVHCWGEAQPRLATAR
jgi:hypothetical protein